MPNERKRAVGYDREAVGQQGGIWIWSTGAHKWRWVSGMKGGQLALVDDRGEQILAVYCRNMQQAGLVAEGFNMGFAMATPATPPATPPA